MSSESRGVDFLAGVIIGSLLGAAVGAAVALLRAPRPGEETRAQLRQRGIELKERMVELSEEARKKAEEAIEEGKKAAAKTKTELLEELEKESGQAQA